MQPKSLGRILDIQGAAEEILDIVGEDPDMILTSRLVGLAVERLLLVIGEALAKIRESEPGLLIHIPDWAAIIGMRNVIVHGYDVIDPHRIRDVVRDDIPVLLTTVRALLQNP